MSEEPFTHMAPMVDSDFEDAQLWDTTLQGLNSATEDGRIEAFGGACEYGGGGDADLFSHPISIQEYQDRLQVIQDRVTRIVGRIGCLTRSLRDMHVGLKNIDSRKSELSSLPESELENAGGDIGHTSTDPPTKPDLNMLAERIGDSVGCQTIEDISSTR